MSTRSRIGIVNEDRSISSIYCHHDGYLSGVGATLARHYQDIGKLRALIALGDISSLGDTPALQDGTRAYSRDAGEDLTPPLFSYDEAHLLQHAEEFTYLFDGKWWVRDHNGPRQELVIALVTEKITS
jgi:hypothetical protein